MHKLYTKNADICRSTVSVCKCVCGCVWVRVCLFVELQSMTMPMQADAATK